MSPILSQLTTAVGLIYLNLFAKFVPFISKLHFLSLKHQLAPELEIHPILGVSTPDDF